MNDQSSTSKIANENAEFWDEPCGSHAARALGVVDASPSSLGKFDRWYFEFYPYLLDYIPFEKVKGKRVLEIGLGYGTVSQRLAESGAIYTGMDIASGPVKLLNHRLKQNHLAGEVIQGSILEPPSQLDSFDIIVAIGCLHHTGDMVEAIRRCHQLLRKGGQFIFMVYSAYSYRRLWNAPIDSLQYAVRELTGYRGVVGISSDAKRAAYDSNVGGKAAPHTDWISRRSLKTLCAAFSSFEARLENFDREIPFVFWSRTELLAKGWHKVLGLDIYAVATK